jgi:uncharacterized membrane protein
MSLLITGLIIFLGVHSVRIAAPGVRERAMARIGNGPWRGIYSLISLVGFALIVWGYGTARASPVVLYVPPPEVRYLTMLLMLPVFPLLIATYLRGRIQAATKHPMLLATMLWSVAHLLSNGTAADLLLFGGFFAWALADRISVKRHPRQPSARRPPRGVNDVIAVLVGLAIYVAFVLWLHEKWIGVPVLAD